MFSFKENIRFNGELVTDKSSIPVFQVLIERAKYDYESDIKFTAHVLPEKIRDLDALISEDTEKFQLVGSPNEVSVVADASWSRHQEGKLTGTINSVSFREELLTAKPKKQTVVVHFSPTNIALSEIWMPVRHWTGEVKAFDDGDRREPFSISTEIGNAKFSLSYEFEDAHIKDVDTSVSIPIPTLIIEVSCENCSKDISEIIKECNNVLRPIEEIISFLGRRQTRWYEIKVLSEDFGGERPVHEARRVRRAFSSPEPMDSLVSPAKFEVESVNALICDYRESPYKEAIRYTINFLNSKWQKEFIETEITMSFTAFETLINGISEYDGSLYIVDDDVFKSFRGRLQKAVKKICNDDDFDRDVRCGFYSKLGELQLAPIVKRAIVIIESTDIGFRDLFSDISSLEEWLRSAYSRRSALIHTGKIKNFKQAIIDANKIHAITERLVYGLIGCKKEWLAPFAYRYAEH